MLILHYRSPELELLGLVYLQRTTVAFRASPACPSIAGTQVIGKKHHLEAHFFLSSKAANASVPHKIYTGK